MKYQDVTATVEMALEATGLGKAKRIACDVAA
ncbi:hypothetical protein Astex_3746 (plasmid) [Asticcacaulis excentricus CB 48]|uniref:Uncharacterized protein n=1 Tax=Asticcacaulis excentricus (strain ATCC 15261 / DSM 4724 / KCTC 12464 / NCIMB 9791 / VKM B-1370 / CB 48) TaxID=573065 RepID=E8RVT5_ASTEC|nr:hypothetical protein Astex_3746 [Asticcacaulis excentricus CB 48]